MAVAIRNNEEVREVKNLAWLLNRRNSVTKLTWFGGDTNAFLIAELPDGWVYVCSYASKKVFQERFANRGFKHLEVNYVVG